MPSSASSMVEIKYKKISLKDLQFDQGDTVSTSLPLEFLVPAVINWSLCKTACSSLLEVSLVMLRRQNGVTRLWQ